MILLKSTMGEIPVLLDFLLLFYSSELLFYYFELHREGYHIFKAQGLRKISIHPRVSFFLLSFNILTHAWAIKQPTI